MTTGPDTPEQPATPQQPPAAPQYNQPPPPAPAPPPAGPVAGALQPVRPDEEKMWGIGAHIGGIILGFIAPLVVWLMYKDRSAYLDRTAKEALNFQISYAIYFTVAGFSIILLIGLLLLPIVGIAWLVLMIVATIKAANMEEYRYPAIIRFIK
jgi:uncharacterized Tic20 family protein